jgi:hypothetical protein
MLGYCSCCFLQLHLCSSTDREGSSWFALHNAPYYCHALIMACHLTDSVVTRSQLCVIDQAPSHLKQLNGTYRSKNQRTTDGRYRFTKIVRVVYSFQSAAGLMRMGAGGVRCWG